MSQSKDKLIPDEPLIYENTDGIIWARYQNKPDIPRWIVGGDPEAISILAFVWTIFTPFRPLHFKLFT